jgi:hypothetical protein
VKRKARDKKCHLTGIILLPKVLDLDPDPHWSRYNDYESGARFGILIRGQDNGEQIYFLAWLWIQIWNSLPDPDPVVIKGRKEIKYLR